MSDDTTIDTAVKAWIDGVLDTEKAILANQPLDNDGAPKLVAPYNTFRAFGFDGWGKPYQTRPDSNQANAQSVNYQDYDFTVTVQCVGRNSGQRARKLEASISLESVRVAFANAGIIPVEQISSTDGTGLMDTRWEEKTIVDFRFRMAEGTAETVGNINTADIAGTYS